MTSSSTSNNCFYVWSMADGDVEAYYRFNDFFICPSCNMAHTSFTCFKTQHGQHAGPFDAHKSQVFIRCRQINDLTTTTTTTTNTVTTPSTFHIWSDLSKARDYYSIHDQYLCPSCSTYNADFDEFLFLHSSHATAFIRPKTTYPPPPSSSSSQPSQSLSQSSTTTTASVNSFYIWNDIDQAEQYYRHNNQYRHVQLIMITLMSYYIYTMIMQSHF